MNHLSLQTLTVTYMTYCHESEEKQSYSQSAFPTQSAVCSIFHFVLTGSRNCFTSLLTEADPLILSGVTLGQGEKKKTERAGEMQ